MLVKVLLWFMQGPLATKLPKLFSMSTVKLTTRSYALMPLSAKERERTGSPYDIPTWDF